MKLKTLKDLEKGIHVGNLKEVLDEERKIGSEWTTSIILAGDLKQEAIKWIKSKYIEINKMSSLIGDKPYMADELNIHIFAISKEIEWIKHFFNIKEEI